METRTLPDIEAALITYLLTVPEIQVYVGTRVWGSAHRPEQPAMPFLELQIVGGRANTEHWIGHDTVMLNAYNSRQLAYAAEDARDLCEIAVAALHDLRNTALGDCLVTVVEDAAGVRPLPDQMTSNPRYTADVLVHYHPLPLGS